MAFPAAVFDLLAWEWIDEAYVYVSTQFKFVLLKYPYDPKTLYWAALAGILILAVLAIRLARRRTAAHVIEAPPDQLEQILERYRSSDTQRMRPASSTSGKGAPDTALMGTGGGSPGAANPQPWLEFFDVKPVRVRLGWSEINIGRHSSNDIVLDDNTVHRHHAKIVISNNNGCELRDQGGANGSLVNGEPCKVRELQDGDLIQLGKVKIRFGAVVAPAN